MLPNSTNYVFIVVQLFVFCKFMAEARGKLPGLNSNYSFSCSWFVSRVCMLISRFPWNTQTSKKHFIENAYPISVFSKAMYI